MSRINLPEIKRYPPVGICIYCGAQPGSDLLTEEHIVPYGLGGRLRLPKASCECCQRKIHKVEEFCLRRQFLEPRTQLGMATRRPKERRKDLRIFRYQIENPEGGAPNLTDNGEWENIPLSEHPWCLMMPEFAEAGGPPRDNYEMRGDVMCVSYMPDFHGKFAEIGNKTLNMQPFSPDLFARMLAKIAHAAAFAALGTGAFEPYLAPFILGDDLKFAHLIGCTGRATPIENWSSVSLRRRHGEIVVHIRLFARITPIVYEVITGRLAQDSPSDARRTFHHSFVFSPIVRAPQYSMTGIATPQSPIELNDREKRTNR